MAKKYIYLTNHEKHGELGISKEVFRLIGEHALRQVNELIGKEKKNSKNKTYGEVNVTIKNNKTDYHVNVLVAKGINKDNVAEQIRNIITSNVLGLCESVPFEIHTKVDYSK